MLERHEIEAFLTLAEKLHFGQAAADLRVSTTRVSQIIRQLERRVGMPLFERTSRRVELTPVGTRLRDDLAPAWEQIAAGFRRAVDTSRGITGTLNACFVGAACGTLLVRAAEAFRRQHPDCEVRIREAQIGEVHPWIREGVADVALTAFPTSAAGLTTGPVLLSEARMLALPARHRLATRAAVSAEDLAGIPMIQLPPSTTAALRDSRTPATTPTGRPIPQGPSAATFQEVLALVGAGRGAFPVGAQAPRYYARPDVAYLPIAGAPPIEWGLIWRTDASTARVLAFSDTAARISDA
ncbi:LysR family transcriptional regulator [Paractinoplanes deccanensis]|uniref:LysR family transcriptional regulator n=1 Tax=Paractinoplanes deccanensis TaxID=113561 RepID=A0ABQ3YI34_9ACTN|nr:LysR family transcriptional regulator [Actinoplanes deccanensis]GID79585.1 LysR family transcriptional regulator [Actinoplanes deccanensis]